MPTDASVEHPQENEQDLLPEIIVDETAEDFVQPWASLVVRTLQPLGSMRAPRCPSRLTTLQVGLGGIYTIKREAKIKDCIEEGSTGSRCAASCALGALGCRQTSFSKDPLSLLATLEGGRED